MSKVQLECQVFKDRAQKILDSVGEDVDGVMVAVGKKEETFSYGINFATILYLLGYGFPETAIVLRRDEVLAITGAKKSAILEQLSTHVKIRYFIRAKDGSNQAAIDQAVREATGGRKIGILKEERGPLVESWEKAQNTVDVTAQVEKVFRRKDAAQINTLRLASVAAKCVLELLESKIRAAVKKDDRLTHEEIGEQVESALEIELKKMPKEIDQTYMELCFRPIIQSGGQYGIVVEKSGEYTNPYAEQLLYFDVITYSVCVVYKGYCSLVGRTLLVNPRRAAEEALEYVILITDEILQRLSVDKTYEEVQEEALASVKSKIDPGRREVLKGVKIDVGKGIGARLEEGGPAEAGDRPENCSVFRLCVSVEGVRCLDDEERDATVLIENVVLMENGHAKVLTPYSRNSKEYVLEVAEDQTKRNSLGRRVRNRDKEIERAAEIAEHQKQLMDELIEAQIEYYRGQEREEESAEEEAPLSYSSYQKESQIPRGQARIRTDKRAKSVVIPVFGVSLPFHIEAIKSVSKTVADRSAARTDEKPEEKNGYLKILLNPPSGESLKENAILSLVFKDTQENTVRAWKEISDLKREEDAEESDEEGPEEGEQEELQVFSERAETLQNVYMRCDHRMGAKKNQPGFVELHKNGVRYNSKKEGVIDVLFSKVKHIFYQPGRGESPALIHFRLGSAVAVGAGDRKSVDVQFFRECVSNSVHDTRKTQNRIGGEEAEIFEEEEEERMREEINEAFKEFAELVSEQSRVILEEPLSKGFYGVPNKQSALIQPTSECLINLTEHPFFVLPFKEIEILSFERRVPGVTTCDMVFVLKDKTKNPVQINGVSSSSVPWLSDFFDSKNICFLETKVNIQWGNVLKSLLSDPVSFYEEGGWAILQASRESEDEEDQVSSDVDNLNTSEEESEEEEFSTNESFSSEDGEEGEDGDEEDDEEDEDDESFVVSEEEEPKKKSKKR